MKLHLVALPHTQVSPKFSGCAYTAKVLKFCKMMDGHHDTYLYAPEGPPVEGAELIPCLTNTQRIQTFGEDDAGRLPSWPTEQQTEQFNKNVIAELRQRVEPRDLILLSMGWTHKPIADSFPNHIRCEPGVGYEGILTPYCAFESYAWMHYVYAKKSIQDGRFFDTVIPNYFDPGDFPLLNQGNGKYLLFLGRIVQRKGPHIAAEIAQKCNIPLKVAGAGGKQVGADIVAPEITVKNAEYVGTVNVQQRSELLANAIALIVPTTYIEPFGGVAVEAMMSGTPVITTDWGAFTETVHPGTGFRFRNMSQAVDAVRKSPELSPPFIRDMARVQYSLDAVRPRFEEWFTRLTSLWEKGWYSD